MSAETLQILYDVTGQSLYWDAPEGQPSSVTSAYVYDTLYSDDDTAETATTGSPSVDSVSTTVDAASGYSQSDRKTVSLTSTTGIEIGRRYLLTAADGSREWVEVTAIDSGSSVTARYPLQNDYATGATFEGTRISISLLDSWIQDKGNLKDRIGEPDYRVRWVYVVGGVTYVHDSYFDVVRYSAGHSVTPQDVAARSPAFLSDLPADDRSDRGRSIIDSAFDVVKMDLLDIGVDVAAVRDSERLDELIIRKTLAMWQMGLLYQAGTTAEAASAAQSEYADFLDKQIRVTSRAEMDPYNDGSGHRVRPQNVWRPR